MANQDLLNSLQQAAQSGMLGNRVDVHDPNTGKVLNSYGSANAAYQAGVLPDAGLLGITTNQPVFKVNEQWTTVEPTASSISLDTATGDINVLVPSYVAKDAEFQETLDTFKAFSRDYKLNPKAEYTLKNKDGSQGETVSLEEYINRLSTPVETGEKDANGNAIKISPWQSEINEFVYLNQVRNFLAPKLRQMDADGNITPVSLTRADVIRMSANGLGKDVKDNTRIAIPKGLSALADIYADEDWDEESSTTTVKKFRDLWHNREKTTGQEILSLYGELGRYLTNTTTRANFEENFDIEKWTSAYALFTFLSESDPTCALFRGAWDNLAAVANGAKNTAVNYTVEATTAVSGLVEKIVDLTLNLYETGLTENPFRDNPNTDFRTWAKTVNEVMDIKGFAQEWGFGIGEFDEAADAYYELENLKKNLKGVLGIGVDATTAKRFANEGPDPNLNSAAKAVENLSTSLIQLALAIHVGNELQGVAQAKLGQAAKALVDGATSLDNMVKAGTMGWVAVMGAEGTAQVLNVVSKILMNPVSYTTIGLVGESIGEAIFQSPQVLAQILQSDDLEPEAQAYLWDTFLGNTIGLTLATGAGQIAKGIGKTALGQGISRNMRNKVWELQGKAADLLDGIRVKLSGSADVADWLNKIGSKGLTEASRAQYARKASIMAQQRTLRAARQAIVENSPKIKILGETAESILKQLDDADDAITALMKYEDILDDIARGNNFRKLTMLEDNPLFDAANTQTRKLAGELVDLQTKAGLKAADTVGGLELFAPEVKSYVNAQLRTKIGLSNIAAKEASKAVNALEGVDQIKKELEHWSTVIKDFQAKYSPELVAKADQFVDATTNWWNKFNTMQANMDLISKLDIEKLRDSGNWGDGGEYYARQQRVQEQSDYLIRRRDGKVSRQLERDMGHYNWGSTEEFVDPMLVMQQEFELAAERANRIDAERTYSQITGTATVRKSAQDVRVAKEVRPYLKAYNNEVHQNIKPLVAQMDTDGLFGQSIKRHQLSQEVSAAEAEARAIGRATISRRTPTMGEMQTTLAKLDEAAVDTLWDEVYKGKTVSQVIEEKQAKSILFYRGQDKVATEFKLNDSSRVSDTIKDGFFTTTDSPYATVFGDKLLRFGADTDAIIELEEAKEIQAAAKKQNANKKLMSQLEATDPDMAVTITEAANGDLKATAILGNKPIIATNNPNTMPIADGTNMRKATEYAYYRDIRPDLDAEFDNQISAAPSKRQLLAQEDATRKASYMKNQVMVARQMEYDAIMRDGYSEAAERAAVASAELEAQDELIYDLGSQALDTFSDTFFAKGSNANKVADEVMRRYGGNTPEAVGEFLYYDALKKNKASLAREVKARAKKAFEDFELEVDGKVTHPYKKNADHLANRVSKNVSDQIEVRFNSSRSAIASMGGDAAKLIDYDSWQREIYEVANEISDLRATNNVIAIPAAGGETEIVEVDPLLSIFINSSTQYTPMGLLGRANYLWMRLFRLGTTGLNPTSWVNQYYRDLGNAWVMGNISETLTDATEQLAEIFGADAGYILSQYSQEVQENLLKLAKEQNKDIATVMAEREIRRGRLYAQASSESEMTRLWRGTKNQWFNGGAKRGLWDRSMDAFDAIERKLTKVNEVREEYLRNLVYGNNFVAAIKGGKSVEQAHIFAEYIASNATTNFTRGVAFMSQFQSTIPYFRAAINGTRSFYRLWSLDPVGVTGRIIGGLAIPAFALTMFSLSSEENRKAYGKIQDYQKENALPIVMNGEAFFIPLPQELSAFVAPFRQAAEAINGLGYNNALEVTVNDLLALSPIDFGGFTDIDSWRVYGEGPTWTERLTRGSAQVFSQIMPKWATAAATAMSGYDLYTGKKIDTSYVTVDPDTGEQRVMSYTAGVIANQLNKVFPNLAAPIAQEMLENLFGTAGADVMDFLADMIGQTASGEFNYGAALTSFGEDAVKALGKPMRPFVEAREEADWRQTMSALWDMKNNILSPNTPQGEAWQAMLTNKRNATTQTERDAVATARANILDPFYKEVMGATKRLIQADPTAFTPVKLASVLSVMNFGTVGDTVNAAASDAASTIYNQSKYAAIETMVRMGFPNVNTPSILGTIKESASGDTYIQWNTPLQILDMENTKQAQGDIFAADLKNLLKRNQITSAELNQAWDDYNAAKSKDEKKKVATEWDTRVAKAIAPYIQQYGAEAITSANAAIDYLDGWLIIPNDYTTYKGKSTYNPKVNIQRGYAKQFIKDVFGAKN